MIALHNFSASTISQFGERRKTISDCEQEAPHVCLVSEVVHSLNIVLSKSMLVAFRTRALAVLSIDISCDSLTIWRSLGALRPTVVLVECNPKTPAGVSRENPPALVSLAKRAVGKLPEISTAPVDCTA